MPHTGKGSAAPTADAATINARLTDARARSAASQEAAAPMLAELQAALREPFDRLLDTVAEEFGLRPADLQRRHRAAMPARRAAVILAVDLLPVTRATVAAWFGIDESTLYRFQRRVRADEQCQPDFARRMTTLRDALKKGPAHEGEVSTAQTKTPLRPRRRARDNSEDADRQSVAGGMEQPGESAGESQPGADADA